MNNRYIMVVFTTKRGYCTARFYTHLDEAFYNINRLLRDGFDIAQMYLFSESVLFFKYYATYILREDLLTGKVELKCYPAFEYDE